MTQRLIIALLIISGAVLLLGFGGRIHGLGDSIAVVRPLSIVAVGVLSVAAILLRPRVVGAAGFCLTAAASLSLLPPVPVSAVPDNARTYSAYQKNLLFRLPDIRPVAEDILKSGADFVMLQELHARNRPILNQLRTEYPYQHICPFSAVGGIAVLSRWPSFEGNNLCGEGGGLAAMQISTPDGPLWVVSLHLHWPFPYRQPQQVEALLPVLEPLDGPILVGGDFNMVPWSHAVEAISRTTTTALSGFAGGTFTFSHNKNGQNLVSWLPRIPIDHILVPETAASLSLQRRQRLGSDHHGLLATFALDTRF